MRGARTEGGLAFEEGEKPKALRVIGPSEAYVQKKITDYLDLSGIVYAVTNAQTVETEGGKRQLVRPPGWPDITALLPVAGQLWGIEVKSEKGRLREAQEDMRALIEASGGLFTVARDCLEIRTILNTHLARYKPAELSTYMGTIQHLKRIYQEHAEERALKQKLARFNRRLKKP